MLAVGMLLIVAWFCYGILPTCYFKYLKNNLVQAKNPKIVKPLVLTFDDGPDPAYTPCVLDLLAVNDVKATFFVLADKARLHPELIARIQQEGHHIAFHALGHKNMWFQTPWQVRDNFDRGLATLGEQASVTEYRPPHGNVNLAALHQIKKRRLHMRLWTVMTQDWSAKSTPATILEKLRRRTRPGAVICLHDSGEGTGGAPGGPVRMMAALAEFIPEAKAQGYQFLLPGDCLEKGGCHGFHRRRQEKACA